MLCFEHTLADCLLFWCPLTCCTGAQLATCTALLLLLLPQEVGANLFVGGLDPEVDEKVGCCAALRCAVLCCAAFGCAALCCAAFGCTALVPLIALRCTARALAAGVLQAAQASAAPLLPVPSRSTHPLLSSLPAAALRHVLSIWSGGGRPKGALLCMLWCVLLSVHVFASSIQQAGTRPACKGSWPEGDARPS